MGASAGALLGVQVAAPTLPGPFSKPPRQPIDEQDLPQWPKNALEPEQATTYMGSMFNGAKRTRPPGSPGGPGDEDEALVHSVSKARLAAQRADDAADRAAEAVKLAFARASAVPAATSDAAEAWSGAEAAAWVSSSRARLNDSFSSYRDGQQRASDALHAALARLTASFDAPTGGMQRGHLREARQTLGEASRAMRQLDRELAPALLKEHERYQGALEHAALRGADAKVEPLAPVWPKGGLGLWPANGGRVPVGGPADAHTSPETALAYLGKSDDPAILQEDADEAKALLAKTSTSDGEAGSVTKAVVVDKDQALTTLDKPKAAELTKTGVVQQQQQGAADLTKGLPQGLSQQGLASTGASGKAPTKLMSFM